MLVRTRWSRLSRYRNTHLVVGDGVVGGDGDRSVVEEELLALVLLALLEREDLLPENEGTEGDITSRSRSVVL